MTHADSGGTKIKGLEKIETVFVTVAVMTRLHRETMIDEGFSAEKADELTGRFHSLLLTRMLSPTTLQEGGKDESGSS